MPQLSTPNGAVGTFLHIPRIEASDGRLYRYSKLSICSVYASTPVLVLARVEELQVKDILREVPNRSLDRMGHANSRPVPLRLRSTQIWPY